MKQLFFIFSMCCMSYTAFCQDDVYYSDDASSTETVGASVQITTAPPEIPVYTQPACPYDGYLWTPGYWAWGIGGYYWVPGVWMAPPRTGFLWTPGYWGFVGGYYGWHRGYWGEHIGFYGGVNYGYGYGGTGFYGGRWEGGAFRYNTAVCHVNTTVIHNTYVSNEGVSRGGSRVSFNGHGGVAAQPNNSERMAMSENHVQPTSEQQSHAHVAANNKSQYASANHGRPGTTAMSAPNGQHYNQNGRAPKNLQSNSRESTAGAAHTNTAPRSNETRSASPRSSNQPANSAPRNNASHNNVQHNSAPRSSAPHNSAPRNSAPRNGGGGAHTGGGGGGHGGRH